MLLWSTSAVGYPFCLYLYVNTVVQTRQCTTYTYFILHFIHLSLFCHLLDICVYILLGNCLFYLFGHTFAGCARLYTVHTPCAFIFTAILLPLRWGYAPLCIFIPIGHIIFIGFLYLFGHSHFCVFQALDSIHIDYNYL